MLWHLWLAEYTITPSLLRAEVIKVTQVITSPFMSSEWLWVGQVFFKLLLESCFMLDGHCWTSPTSRPSLPLTNTLRQLADHRGVEEKLHCWKCCAFCSGMPWQWNLGKICKKNRNATCEDSVGIYVELTSDEKGQRCPFCKPGFGSLKRKFFGNWITSTWSWSLWLSLEGLLALLLHYSTILKHHLGSSEYVNSPLVPMIGW